VTLPHYYNQLAREKGDEWMENEALHPALFIVSSSVSMSFSIEIIYWPTMINKLLVIQLGPDLAARLDEYIIRFISLSQPLVNADSS